MRFVKPKYDFPMLNSISKRINLKFYTQNVIVFYFTYAKYGGRGECSFGVIRQNVVSSRVGQTDVMKKVFEELRPASEAATLRLCVFS